MTLLEMKRSPRRSRSGRPSGGTVRGPVPAYPQGEPRGHVPVLATELIELLDPQPGQTMIDCTFGDGGHARLLAERLGPSRTPVAVDRDPLAEERGVGLGEGVTRLR